MGVRSEVVSEVTYSGDLLKLDGISFNKIIEYTVQRNKLWSDDSGRNMGGSNKGTLIGIFPKLLLQVEPLTEDEISWIETKLDQATISTSYYNSKYKCLCTGEFYAGDYETTILRREDMMHDKFSVNLIPNEREEKHAKSK